MSSLSTRPLVHRRLAQSRSDSASAACPALVCCTAVPLLVIYAQQSQAPPQQPLAIVMSVKALHPIDGSMPQAHVPSAENGGGASSAPSATLGAASVVVTGSTTIVAEHESSQAMAVLNRERARAGGNVFAGAFRVYRPAAVSPMPGGDLDDPVTLARAVAAAAADGEIMMLCIGGSGSMRTGMNLVLNFRTMGLYHMLILAPDPSVCDDLWLALPSLACVWWPSMFKAPRPSSLYNTMFSRRALAFFEGRKLCARLARRSPHPRLRTALVVCEMLTRILPPRAFALLCLTPRLLERLVVEHHLNVLHLDADTVWFANPYPLFKTLYASYSLIIQTDNPFVNAGILYVQNVADGDAAAWVLQELNRRIARFTYEPASVRSLPHSSWSTAPHFANADEQANLNDIVTSALIGRPSFTAGVEFYEARFKRDRGDAYARQLMANRGWGDRMLQGDVRPARSRLRTLRPDRVFEPLVHLCKPDLWVGVSTAKLAVPNNSSAPRRQLLLAPEWLFSHFPYGGGPSAPPPAFLPLPTPVCMPACVRACACSLLSVVSRLPRRLLGLRGSLGA